MKKLHFNKWSLLSSALLLIGLIFWVLKVDILFPRVADDFYSKSNIISVDNFYDPIQKKFSGEIVSNTKLNYEVVKKEGSILLIHHTFDVKKPSGDQIILIQKDYKINQFTGKHVGNDKYQLGYLFAPPHVGNEFRYLHINMDEPLKMIYLKSEEIEGLNLKIYGSIYNVNQTSLLGYLPDVPLKRGVELNVHLKIWVEPISGLIVKYEESSIGWFYDINTKKHICPWNKFTNKFEAASISRNIRLALLEKEKRLWLEQYIPIGILIIILIILLLGLSRKNNYL